MVPSSLLELVSLRLSSRSSSTFLSARMRHVQISTAPQNPRHTTEPSVAETRDLLKAREAQDQALSQLEARVASLKVAAEESLQTTEAKREGPYFSETSLQDIYRDLLAQPERDPAQEQSVTDIDAVSIKNIEQVLHKRLSNLEAAAEGQAKNFGGLSSRLRTRITDSTQDPAWPDAKIDINAKVSEDIAKWDTFTPLRELVSRLRVVLDSLSSSWPHREAEQSSVEVMPTPFRLLLITEWRALYAACIHAEDPRAAEAVLELMKRVGLSPTDEQCDMLLNHFAERGQIEEADAHVARFSSDVPRERQRDLLIETRVKAQQLDKAYDLLHLYEARNHPAPIKSYTRIIMVLLDRQGAGSAQQLAQAWDLFAHMRYVAHPIPDPFLYSTMIRAAPEPQRALDLFTEMTVEQGIVPDTFAYTAVIRACARHKSFAMDAFRIAREMLNSHRDAHGEIPPHLRPDKYTFLGLLDAAKRLGDLSRARWIISEMAQGMPERHDSESLVYVDENALTHFFHTYATYRPPFRRESVPIMPEEANSPADEEDLDVEENEVSPQATNLQEMGLPRSRALPQSRQELIREITMLWERIETDRALRDDDNSKTHNSLIFGRVEPNDKLLNAYLAAHFAHSPPSEAYKIYEVLFERIGVQRSAWTYVLALEAYSWGNRHIPRSELLIVLSSAQKIWKDWSVLEDAEIHGLYDQRDSKIQARLVERAWTAMIRLLTLSENLDEAEDLLRRFVRRYPADLVKQPAPADPRRSNRTRLFAERPIVRLMEPSAVPEDRISPFLTFNDIALLHNRALTQRKMKLVSYIKWVVSGYLGALRQRRQAQYHNNRTTSTVRHASERTEHARESTGGTSSQDPTRVQGSESDEESL